MKRRGFFQAIAALAGSVALPALPAKTVARHIGVDLALGTDTTALVTMLNRTNEILADMPWVELPKRTTIRTGLPSAVWRKL